ncbi:MAG: MtrB/PioB family decaheme-associated outer membrane protein [Candidatus Omnitrophica bacterium]|nr:MtrB/PioB family decaheme-associated outer membrane protein [Candidatus Omnitrophota bacterium]
MKSQKICSLSTLTLALLFFLIAPAQAQIEVGDFTIRGEAELGGTPRILDGAQQKFGEYRDLRENVIVPQLQLMIGGKKEDFYLNFDSSNLGRDNQNYLMRFGRYGLLDVEVEWDQFPHLFSINTARTPYARSGNWASYTLSSKPTTTAGTDVRDWVNANASIVDLKLFNGIGKFKLRYTPVPGWTFTGGYSSQNNSGTRAIGELFGTSGGTYKVTELVEPLDYQIHNIDLGGEYAGSGWSVGLRYNASLFHNNVSSLTWDNPTNLSGTGAACTDGSGFTTTSSGTDANRGPCRGRMDLYPSNQAHTWTLTGTTKLPFKSNFMGTVSYGVRLQNDTFLPFTTNTALGAKTISRDSLDGDVRPFLVNATLVNRFFDPVDLKAYYRFYDFDNRSKIVDFPNGRVINDSTSSGASANASVRSFPWAYSKQNTGLDASYNITRWLSAKLGYVLENMHRERREVLDSNEHTFGPTFDIKPTSWALVRLGYKRSLRDAHNYDGGRYVVVDTSLTTDEMREEVLEELRKFDQAARTRDKFSYFGQITPWENLNLFGGFDFFLDEYTRTVIGLQDDLSYVPSVGFTYAPLDWMMLFGNYSWERFDWKLQAMHRTTTTQTTTTDPGRTWRSRGRDQTNTVSFGTDLKLIQNLLGLRIQYTFSEGSSLVKQSGNSAGTDAAFNLPIVNSRWHEFLTRFEYQLYKNVTLRLGYYFNRYNQRDYGVDIMKPWMGDVDTNNGIQRSIYLGDRIKRPYTAHVGLLGLRLSF